MIGPQPGDIGFAHTTGLMGRLIRLGEWLRFRKGSHWNHAFVVDRVVDGVPYIIQATLRGVTDSAPLATVAPGGNYVTMPPPMTASRSGVLKFARAQVGAPYSFATIVAIAIDIVTWNWFPSFRGARRNSWICSALVGESLRFGGWLHDFRDIYEVTPSQLWEAISE